ncbi:biotin--[acetyl-CoA-carboxylase] ligase [Candidatus Marinamargulisbacteria bacterium SCGC AG-439-L15]|nr:biotin--[acetyl-CoA-carboxylase] ligase [Candidatus Marinamargulisbacteria bacterium SCGC AG-439-L15]
MKHLHFETIDSTNSEAKRQAREGTIGPLLITATEQTQGRGQKDRVWISEKGGLYLSLLTPATRFEFKQIPSYNQKIGAYISDFLAHETGETVNIEWPNDLILDDKKVGGILIESISSATQKGPSCVIMGIGLNINQASFPIEIKQYAISIHQKTGEYYELSPLVSKLVKELNNVLSWY